MPVALARETERGSSRRATGAGRGRRRRRPPPPPASQPPAKTERRRNSCRSCSERRSYDHSIVARSVCWRGSASRPPRSRSRRCAEPLEDLRRAERPRAGGGELDRQGQAVEAAAELGDLVRRLELGTSAEEIDGLGLGERRHRVLDLPLHAQELARGDEQREVRAGAEQRGELRRCVDHLLEVVDDEQQLPLADVLGEAVPRAERARDRLRDERGVAERGEADPEDARLEGRDERGGGLDRDPRLPRPAGAGQRDESVAALDPGANLRELALAADEGARRAGAGSCSRSSSAAGSVSLPSWKIATGSSTSLRRCSPRSVSLGRRRDPPPCPRGRPGRRAPRCRDSGRDVDVLADVTLRGQEGMAGVEADANADRAGRERLGQLLRRGDGGRCGWEGEEERVALRVHLDSVVVAAQACADQPAVLRQLLGVSLGAELAQQAASSPRRR